MLRKLFVIALICLLNQFNSASITTNVPLRIPLKADESTADTQYDIVFDSSIKSGTLYLIMDDSLSFTITLSNGDKIYDGHSHPFPEGITHFNIKVYNQVSRNNFLDIIVKTDSKFDISGYDKITSLTLGVNPDLGNGNYVFVDKASLKADFVLQMHAQDKNAKVFTYIKEDGTHVPVTDDFTDDDYEELNVKISTGVPSILYFNRVDETKESVIKYLIRQTSFEFKLDSSYALSGFKLLSINPNDDNINVKFDLSKLLVSSNVSLVLSSKDSVTSANALIAGESDKVEYPILPGDKNVNAFTETTKGFSTLSANKAFIYVTLTVKNLPDSAVTITPIFLNAFQRINLSANQEALFNYVFSAPSTIALVFIKSTKDITLSTNINGGKDASDKALIRPVEAVSKVSLSLKSTSNSHCDFAILDKNYNYINKSFEIFNQNLIPGTTNELSYLVLSDAVVKSASSFQLQLLSSGNSASVNFAVDGIVQDTKVDFADNYAAVDFAKDKAQPVIVITRTKQENNDNLKVLVKLNEIDLPDNTLVTNLFSLKKVDSEVFNVKVAFDKHKYLRVRICQTIVSAFAKAVDADSALPEFPIIGEDNAFNFGSNKLVSITKPESSKFVVLLTLTTQNLKEDGLGLLFDEVDYSTVSAADFASNGVDLKDSAVYVTEIQNYKNLSSGSNKIYFYIPNQDKLNLSVVISESNDFNKKAGSFIQHESISTTGLVRFNLEDLLFESHENKSLFLYIFNTNKMEDAAPFKGEVFVSSNTYIYSSVMNIQVDLQPQEEAYYLISSIEGKKKVFFGYEKGIKLQSGNKSISKASSIKNLFKNTEFKDVESFTDESVKQFSSYKIINTSLFKRSTYLIATVFTDKNEKLKEGSYHVFSFVAGPLGSSNKIFFEDSEKEYTVQALVLSELDKDMKITLLDTTLSNNSSIIKNVKDQSKIIVSKSESIEDVFILLYVVESVSATPLTLDHEETATGKDAYFFSFNLTKENSSSIYVENIIVTGAVANFKYFISQKSDNNSITLPLYQDESNERLLNNINSNLFIDHDSNDLIITFYIQPQDTKTELKVKLSQKFIFAEHFTGLINTTNDHYYYIDPKKDKKDLNIGIYLNDNTQATIKYQPYGSSDVQNQTVDKSKQSIIDIKSRIFFFISSSVKDASYLLNLKVFNKNSEWNYNPTIDDGALTIKKTDSKSYSFKRTSIFNDPTNSINYFLFVSEATNSIPTKLFSVLSQFADKAKEASFIKKDGEKFDQTFESNKLLNVKLLVQEPSSNSFYLYPRDFTVDSYSYLLELSTLYPLEIFSAEQVFYINLKNPINSKIYIHFSYNNNDSSNNFSGSLISEKINGNERTETDLGDITENIKNGYYIFDPKDDKMFNYSFKLTLKSTDIKRPISLFIFDNTNTGTLAVKDQGFVFFNQCGNADGDLPINISFKTNSNFNKANLILSATSAGSVQLNVDSDIKPIAKIALSEQQSQSVPVESSSEKAALFKFDFKILSFNRQNTRVGVVLDYIFEISELKGLYTNKTLTNLNKYILFFVNVSNYQSDVAAYYKLADSNDAAVFVYETSKTDITKINKEDISSDDISQKIANGGTFTKASTKAIIIRIINRSSNDIEFSSNLIYNKVDESIINTVNCTTTNPAIVVLSNKPSFLSNKYKVFAPLGSSLKVSLTYNSLLLNTQPEVSVKQGMIQSIHFNEEKALNANSIYLYLFALEKTSSETTEQKYQLFQDTVNKLISINNSNVNHLSYHYNLQSNQSQYILFSSASALQKEVQYNFYLTGSATATYKVDTAFTLSSLSNIDIQDLKSVDPTFNYSSGYIIVKLSADATAASGSITLAILQQQTQDANIDAALNTESLFLYSIPKSATFLMNDPKAITLTFPDKEITATSLLVIKTLNGSGIFTYKGENHNLTKDELFKIELVKGVVSFNISQDSTLSNIDFMIYLLPQTETTIVNNGKSDITKAKDSLIIKRLNNDTSDKYRRIIFDSTSDSNTFSSFKLINSGVIFENGNTYLNSIGGELQTNYVINSNIQNKLYDYSFTLLTNDDFVFIQYELSKDQEGFFFNYISEDKNSEPISDPSERKVDFASSKKQIIRIRNNSSKVTILRYYEEKELSCQYIDTTDNNNIKPLTSNNIFLSNIVNHDVTLFCPDTSDKIIFTVNNVPASYTDANIALSNKAVSVSSNLTIDNDNKVNISITLKEKFLQNIQVNNVSYYLYKYPKTTELKNKVDSLSSFITQTPAEKSQNLVSDLANVKVDANTGLYDVYIFAQDGLSYQAALYDQAVIDSQGSKPSHSGTKWYVILIIIISCLIGAVIIGFIIRRFLCRKDEDAIENALLNA